MHDLFVHHIKTKPISTSSSSSFKLVYLVFVDAAGHSPLVDPWRGVPQLQQLRQFLSVFLASPAASTIDSSVFRRRRRRRRRPLFPDQCVANADCTANGVDDEWDAECQGLRMGGHVRPTGRLAYINWPLPPPPSPPFPRPNLGESM